MKLVKHTTINSSYFKKRQGPTEKEWHALVDSGAINGKLLGTKVYIDEDDFISRDKFGVLPANEERDNVIDIANKLLGNHG